MNFIKFYTVIISLLLFLVKPACAMQVLRDAEIEKMIRDIAKPIFTTAGLDASNVNVYIYHTADMNAFVSEDKNVYVSTGVIAFSDEPDTIAGILAHETGHIVSGHIAARKEEIKRLEKEMMFSMVAGATIGAASKSSEAGIGSYTAIQSYYMNKFLQFSRSQEEAADNVGLQFLANLGISNQGLIDFLQELMKYEKLNQDQGSIYLRSHPISKERVNKIRDYNSEHPNNNTSIFSKEARDRFKYAAVKSLALLDSPDDTIQQLLPLKQGKYQSYAIAIAAYRKGDYALALDRLSYLNSISPNNAYFQELFAQVYTAMQDPGMAVRYYELACRNMPKSLILKYEYANALLNIKSNIPGAINLLESFLAVERENATAYATLAKAYAINNDSVNSYLASALSMVYQGEYDAATRFKNLAINAGVKSKGSKELMRLTELESAMEDLKGYIES